MPYIHEWVEPAIFFEYNGIQIYYTYRDDDIEQRTSEYYYTTDKYETDYKTGFSEAMFDVRELPNWIEPLHPPYLDFTMGKEVYQKIELQWQLYNNEGVLDTHIKKIIREAIDLEYIPIKK